MVGRKPFPLALCLLLVVIPVFSQSEDGEEEISGGVRSDSEDFWFCPGTEFALYSITIKGGAYGGGFALGYGRGACIGLRAVFLFENSDRIITLEFDFLLRFYLLGKDSLSGPFLQFLGGPVIFALNSGFEVPAEYGIFSAGLSFGWRFLLNNRWFVEPMIRGGYPYIAGVGVSAGMRF